MTGYSFTVVTMETITLLKPEGLVNSPAFSHVAVIPPGATTIFVRGQNAVDATGALGVPGALVELSATAAGVR